MSYLKKPFVLLAFLILLAFTQAKYAMNETQMSYLKSFGYMDKETKMGDTSAIMTALEHFQEFMGLEQTGEMNAETMEMMSKPRCGMKDMEPGSRRRKKRFVLLGGSPWSNKELTVSIASYPRTIPDKRLVSRTLRKAFQFWAKESPLRFRVVRGAEADILIRFATDDHSKNGDNTFDGAGKVLAHAFGPEDGDIHFDDDENWTLRDTSERSPSTREINLLLVAVHEIGHSLGLGHSRVRESIMFPTYNPKHSLRKPLHLDDIQGIQTLYGGNRPRTGRSLNDQQDVPDLCSDPELDAVTRGQNGKLYFFKGDVALPVSDTETLGSPLKVRSLLGDESIDKIDAAFSWRNGYSYLFSGNRFWMVKLQDNPQQRNGPFLISNYFQDIPGDLDAAFDCGSFLHFIKGDLLWYHHSGRTLSNPRSLKALGLAEGKVDAAFSDGPRNIYLIQGRKVYLADLILYKILPGYPKDLVGYFVECEPEDEPEEPEEEPDEEPEEEPDEEPEEEPDNGIEPQ